MPSFPLRPLIVLCLALALTGCSITTYNCNTPGSCPRNAPPTNPPSPSPKSATLICIDAVGRRAVVVVGSLMMSATFFLTRKLGL